MESCGTLAIATSIAIIEAIAVRLYTYTILVIIIYDVCIYSILTVRCEQLQYEQLFVKTVERQFPKDSGILI